MVYCKDNKGRELTAMSYKYSAIVRVINLTTLEILECECHSNISVRDCRDRFMARCRNYGWLGKNDRYKVEVNTL